MAYENPIPYLDEDISCDESETLLDYEPINEVYFAFIDVLGFKRDFDNMKISQEDIPNKYRDVFNYYFSLMNASKFMNEGKSKECYAGQTSDSLYFYTKRTDYLMQFIKIYSHFSLYAMSKNVFFRGGIAKGKLFKKEMYQFYGDSVIGAYLLECNISKNPIIVIDDQTHDDMCGISEYNDIVETSGERHYIKPFHYLNRKIDLDIDSSVELKQIKPQCIQDHISKNKKAFEYDEKNYNKYTFLLNQFIENSNK